MSLSEKKVKRVYEDRLIEKELEMYEEKMLETSNIKRETER